MANYPYKRPGTQLDNFRETIIEFQIGAEQDLRGIQSQIGKIVAEGDSSPQAAAAQVDAYNKSFNSLKERLDENQLTADKNLKETVKEINGKKPTNGILNLSIPDPNNVAYKQDLQNLGSATPKGAFANLAALRTAFPTGTNGIYVISEDGKWYFWNGTTWTPGGTFITDSVGLSKARRIFLQRGANAAPNYDTATNIFTISADTVLMWGNEYYLTDKENNIPIDTTRGSNFKVLFDTTTKLFRSVYFRDKIGPDELIVCTIKLGYGIHDIISDATFMHTINGVNLKIQKYDALMDRPIRILLPINGTPNLDTTNHKLTFPPMGGDYILYVGNDTYPSFIPESGMVIDLTPIVNEPSTAHLLLYNPQTKEFTFRQYNNINTLKDTHVIIGTIRHAGPNYRLSLPFNFTINGRSQDQSTSMPIVQNYLDDFVRGICHRGYSDAPENTLPAYRLAKEKGYAYVECDIDFTSDGIPVLIHDATINRTARNDDGTTIPTSINVNAIPLSEIKKYDFGIFRGERYKGTRIPTLEEFLILCKKLSLHPYIEMKGNISQQQGETLIKLVRKWGMLDKVSWISFQYGSLSMIKSIYPKSRLGFVVGPLTEEVINTTKQLKNDVNNVFIDCSDPVSLALVETSQNSGMDVEVWTVNDRQTIINVVEKGVSGITTDNQNIAEILRG